MRFDIKNLAGAGTKLDSLYFNFAHGALNPNQLTFSNVSAASGTYATLLAASTSSTSDVGLKADGTGGFFDGKFAYSTNNFLGNGQILSFQLSATGQDLAESDFRFLSLPGPGGGYAVASHFQALPGSYGTSSAWVGTVAAVPLPAGVWLFGSGLVGVAGALRKQLSLA